MVALQMRSTYPPTRVLTLKTQISFISSVQVYGSCWAQGMSVSQTTETLRQWRQDAPPR